MVAFTTSKQLFQVANSSYVGTWDQPTNSNWGVVDAALGQVVTIPLNNSPVILASNQYQCYQITLNSTLTGNVAITFPTSFYGPYAIYNACTGSSAFVITLQTTAGGEVISPPPGEAIEVLNDGVNLRYRNLGRVGSYWDYAGSSVPAWVTSCTVPPYLNCDGSAFSSITYPFLATILGGTTLPDSKGRVRAALNQGSARLVSTGGGVDGNTNLAGGGTQTTTLSSQNLPNTTFPVTDPTHAHAISALSANLAPGGGGANIDATYNAGHIQYATSLAATGITVASGGSGAAVPITQPTYIGGLTLIRAA